MVSFCESIKFRIEENLKLKNTIDPKTFFFAEYFNVRSKRSILKYLKSTPWIRHLVNDFYERSVKVIAFMFHENTDLGHVANLWRAVLSLIFTLTCYQWTELSECVCQNAEKQDRRWQRDGPQTWLGKGWLQKLWGLHSANILLFCCDNCALICLFTYLSVYLLFAVLAIEPRVSCMLDKESVYPSPSLLTYN